VNNIMLRLFLIFTSLFSALLLAGCNPGADAYNRGNQAYEKGQYQASFINYLYAANQGIIPAQYAVGYQYFYGQGTKRDEPLGIKWLERAAPHSERATYALHLLQENRPDIPWTYQLKKVTQTQQKKSYSYHSAHNACVISVKCIK
jgi:TPR repeat protein